MASNFFDNFTTTPPEGNQRQDILPEEVCANEMMRLSIAAVGGPSFSSEDDCLDYFYPDPNKTSRMVKAYFLAFIIPLGLLLNLLSGVVFLRTNLRRSATALYFSALACADNVVLLAELFNWFSIKSNRNSSVTGVNFVHESTWACKLTQFLRYFGFLLSAWLVVIICIERVIAVSFPLRASSSTTKRNSKFIIPALAVVCLGLASPALVFLRLYQKDGKLICGVPHEHNDGHKAWSIAVGLVGELAVPSVIVTIFTALIIFKLVRANRRRSALTSGQQESKMNGTFALVAVAIAFVALRAPYFIAYTYYLTTKDNSAASLQARDGSYIFVVLNYAINFFLYMVTTKKFRKELKDIFLWKPGKRGTPHVRLSKLAPKRGKESTVSTENSLSTTFTSYHSAGTNT